MQDLRRGFTGAYQTSGEQSSLMGRFRLAVPDYTTRPPDRTGPRSSSNWSVDIHHHTWAQ
jgi:hypothetical protein